ncbi:MAG: PTS sugar transporter subunit IIA [Reyranella sp.]|uniref:PTS sugar transporter subunit IIA n=1 Tax=Reyranella sp. TaxID=1929291 RepID=UPI00272F3923|nr:PTS sugar transporter subunit IIA [Reyranella sp.]MDP1967244.1 PTS sugar transporter subunit IIA [Reyranella sp.]MDP2373401.1 PTS sugar transporter subunit IIA [Reyranella sp.]
MEIADLLTGPEAVLASVKMSGKKALLAELASRAASVFGLEERRLFDRLIEREALGSTGIGGGIAIPHARMGSLTTPRGLFARLAQPIAFDAIDDRPVDVVFLLVAPEGAGADHLKALARVSRLLRDRSLVDKLRATENAEALYALLVESVQTQSAA